MRSFPAPKPNHREHNIWIGGGRNHRVRRVNFLNFRGRRHKMLG